MPYQLPKNPLLPADDQNKLMKIQGKYLMVDGLNMSNNWESAKLHFNEICVWRVELPCYPNVWQEHLTLQIDLMVLVDKVSHTDKELQKQLKI